MQKTSFLAASVLLVLALIAIYWRNSHLPSPVALTPALTGQPEYCLSCHTGLPEISPSHPVETFGCVTCHGGERLALDADLAHSSLRGGRNPSDLSVAEESCGGSNCHSGDSIQNRDHISRVRTSLQSTYAGAIATLRYTFGAQPDLAARLGVQAIAAPVPDRNPVGEPGNSSVSLSAFDPAREASPFLQEFARNCLTCHLSAEPPPGAGYSRLTGCAACHTPTAGLELERMDAWDPSTGIHQLTTRVPYTQCNTCHNRGNYDLRSMEFHPREDNPSDRLHDYYQPIAQFTRCEYELDCVDCHTRLEAMGDGHLYNRQADLQYVQCRDCHGTLEAPPVIRALTNPEDIAFRLAFLNPVVDLEPGDKIVLTQKGEPLWNLRQLPDETLEMTAKVTGARYEVPLVQGSACEQKPDEQESQFCHACHAVDR